MMVYFRMLYKYLNLSVTLCQLTLDPIGLEHHDAIELAMFGDAEHRGHKWYAYDGNSSGESGSDLKSSASVLRSR